MAGIGGESSDGGEEMRGRLETVRGPPPITPSPQRRSGLQITLTPALSH
jgi:hypothetical protein